MTGSVSVFIITFVLFHAAALLYPIDKKWYRHLQKPIWTPSGAFTGTVWLILCLLISLSVAIVYRSTGDFHDVSFGWFAVLILNYAVNQAYRYFQFRLKDCRLAFYDCFLTALTATLLLIQTKPYSAAAAWLLLPYVVWTCFAALLSWVICQMNRR